MTPDTKKDAAKLAELLCEIRGAADGLPEYQALVADLFFVERFDASSISYICEIDTPGVTEIITDFLGRLLLASPSFQAFVARSARRNDPIGRTLAARRPGPSERQRIARILIAACDAPDAAGSRARQLVGAALSLEKPRSVGGSHDSAGHQDDGNAPIKVRPTRVSGRARTGRPADQAEHGQGAASQPDREPYLLSAATDFETIVRAGESRDSDRASKLIYGAVQPTRLSLPQPWTSVFFSQNHLGALLAAAQIGAPPCWQSVSTPVLHKIQTVMFGLMCYETASGTKRFDESVWVSPLVSAFEQRKHVAPPPYRGLIAKNMVLTHDLLVQTTRPEERQQTLRRIVGNLGKLARAFGGRLTDIVAQRHWHQSVRTPQDKKLVALHLEIQAYGAAASSSGFGMIRSSRLQATAGERTFDAALVITARDSGYRGARAFIDTCTDLLRRVGIHAVPLEIQAGDNAGLWRELGRQSRPHLSFAEVSDLSVATAGTAVCEWPGLRSDWRDMLFIDATSPAITFMKHYFPVFVYQQGTLEDVVWKRISELPSVHELEIRLSDEQGTLWRVVRELALLGANIVESKTWTVEKGSLALLRIVLELPPGISWPSFETALGRGLEGIATLRRHRLVFAPENAL